jgi:hypothetical protein
MGRDLEKLKAWKKTERGQRMVATSKRAYFWKHQDKIAARYLVRVAVNLGIIDPVLTRKCVDCGGQSTEYDHHMGYDREHWLVVEPVCKSCHNVRGILRKHNKVE